MFDAFVGSHSGQTKERAQRPVNRVKILWDFEGPA